jgi:hypothetical protein
MYQQRIRRLLRNLSVNVGLAGGDNDVTTAAADSAWKSFRRAERRERWLWW